MDEVHRKILVAQTLDGQRLDLALVKAGIVISRSQGQKLVREKRVLVNSQFEKISHKLQSGDLIEVSLPAPKKIDLVPYDFPLKILFEDSSLIVVNKPAGLVVHPAHGHQNDTLINALLARNTELSQGSHPFRPGLVHRIDKGTSGLLVLAKTQKAHNHIAKQFLKKTVFRIYTALCFSNKKMEKGSIESYISRDPANRKRFIASDHGKYALTHYFKKAELGAFALYELKLETGRTHQIRVHLSFHQNPIVGDTLYNGKKQANHLKNQKLKKFILQMDRFALHAGTLGFIHPVSHKKLLFKVPIPSDIKPLFEMLGIQTPEDSLS